MQGSQLEPSKSWHEKRRPTGGKVPYLKYLRYLTLPYQAAKPGTTYPKCGHNVAAPIHRDAKFLWVLNASLVVVLQIDLADWENLNENLHWSTQTLMLCRTFLAPSAIFRPQKKMLLGKTTWR